MENRAEKMALKLANEKIQEQELIIYGLNEGADEWKLKCSDLSKDIRHLMGLLQKMHKERTALLFAMDNAPQPCEQIFNNLFGVYKIENNILNI